MMNLTWIDYLLIVLPGIGLTLWANGRIARVYRAGLRIASASGLTGAEAAADALQAGGVHGVEVAAASGELSNHFDPSRNRLRLSRGVHDGGSLAAVGAAIHEAGHALQDAAGYPGLAFRNWIVPWTGLGAQVAAIVLAAGLLLGMIRLIVLAIGLFYAILLIHLVNVVVERDASRRGREFLRSTGTINDGEEPVVAQVSDALAWAHVAAVWTAGFSMADLLDRLASTSPDSLPTSGLKD